MAFALTGMGFIIAWQMDSSSGFHAIMNLLLVPMWMVSGSLFPMSTAHGWIRAIMWVNPLTYSHRPARTACWAWATRMPGVAASLAVTAAFGLALLVASGLLAARQSTRQQCVKTGAWGGCWRLARAADWPAAAAAPPLPVYGRGAGL